jgi:PRC-barrel domain
MLIRTKTLRDYKLAGIDGEIGKVKDFYFDDQHWAIRYLVADTGSWLMDNQVLISPYALTAVKKEHQDITVNLSKRQIENSPSLNTHKPVSRQFEEVYNRYYGWPGYYIALDRERGKEPSTTEKAWDPHLRSTCGVSGYHVQATDAEIGHVEDFIIDDEIWAIRYLIVDTKNWWPGKRVLVSPQWIESVSWDKSKVFVHLSQDAIKRSPVYTEDTLPTRDYEAGLYRHYDRQAYWSDEPIAKKHFPLGGRG